MNNVGLMSQTVSGLSILLDGYGSSDVSLLFVFYLLAYGFMGFVYIVDFVKAMGYKPTMAFVAMIRL